MDAFAASAAVAPLVQIVREAPEPSKEPTFPMNVRFSASAKAALEKLAAADRRSQNQTLMLLVEPMLIARARELGG